METFPGLVIQSWIDDLTINMARPNPVRTTITQKSFSMSLIKRNEPVTILYVATKKKIKTKSAVFDSFNYLFY
jgi:hypothetical protein